MSYEISILYVMTNLLKQKEHATLRVVQVAICFVICVHLQVQVLNITIIYDYA